MTVTVDFLLHPFLAWWARCSGTSCKLLPVLCNWPLSLCSRHWQWQGWFYVKMAQFSKHGLLTGEELQAKQKGLAARTLPSHLLAHQGIFYTLWWFTFGNARFLLLLLSCALYVRVDTVISYNGMNKIFCRWPAVSVTVSCLCPGLVTNSKHMLTQSSVNENVTVCNAYKVGVNLYHNTQVTHACKRHLHKSSAKINNKLIITDW